MVAKIAGYVSSGMMYEDGCMSMVVCMYGCALCLCAPSSLPESSKKKTSVGVGLMGTMTVAREYSTYGCG